MEKWYFGVDVGGTSIKMGLICPDKSDEFTSKWEIPTNRDNNGENILPDIVESIKRTCCEYNIEYSSVAGIGIGLPGPVTKDGMVLKCANIPWGIKQVKNEMQELTGIQNIAVGNDANVAALGEMWLGGGKGYNDIVMVTLGTGVGGGIILNGKILPGNSGAGGEIGHITVNPTEEDSCGCGNKGCIEQYASATGIVRLAKKANINLPEGYTTKEIFDAAREGNEEALSVVEEACRYLGIALSNVSSVVDPQAFVIGGGVSKAGNILIDKVEKYYNDNSMFALKNKVFRLASLGNDAGIYGCVKMVMDNA